MTYARTVTKEGHRSPFEFLSDLYFGRVNKAIVRACRGGGKTVTFAALCVLRTAFNEEYTILHIGGTEDQAKKGYAYYAGDPKKEGEPGFMRRPHFRGLLSESLMSKTALTNGSVVEIATGGSMKSVSGPHPILLIADELDHIKPDILDTALQAPMSKGIFSAQVAMGSSQYHSFGPLQALLDSADERGIEVYEYDLLDIIQPCGRSYPKECKECPFYVWTNPFSGQEEELCHGRGAKSGGHYAYQDAVDKMLATHNLENFALQNLLMKGTSQGLVYGNVFDEDSHVQSFPPIGADLTGWKCFAGVDLRTKGRIEVIAEAPQVMPNGKKLRWVIKEWADNNSTPSRIRSAAFEMRQRVREEHGLSLEVFWMESAAADEAKDWQTIGLNGRIIPKEVRSVAYGIGQVRDAFRDVHNYTSLYIDPGCTILILALTKGYHCKSKPDGTFDRDTPAPPHSHGPDALRYACLGGAIKPPARLPEPDAPTGGWDIAAGRSKWVPH